MKKLTEKYSALTFKNKCGVVGGTALALMLIPWTVPLLLAGGLGLTFKKEIGKFLIGQYITMKVTGAYNKVKGLFTK